MQAADHVHAEVVALVEELAIQEDVAQALEQDVRGLFIGMCGDG